MLLGFSVGVLFLRLFSSSIVVLLLFINVLCLLSGKECLVVDDVVRAEHPRGKHADEVHQDVTVEPHVKGPRERPLGEPEKVNRNSDSSDNCAKDVESQPGREVLLAMVDNEDVDRDDRIVEADDNEHESADDAECRVRQRRRCAERNSDSSENGNEHKVELAQVRAIVERIVCVRDLVSDERERDECEVEKSNVGIDGHVETAEGVEEDGGRHGTDAGDVYAKVPEVVDGPVRREDKLECVDLDTEHYEKGDEMGPDVHGFVVVLKRALDTVTEVVPDAVAVCEEGLLHPVKVALFHRSYVPDFPFSD